LRIKARETFQSFIRLLQM